MIRACHAQFCMTYPMESPEKGRERAHELLIEAQTDLDENFGKLDEMQSLLAAQLLIAISIYFKDIDVTGKYMKFLDQFDSREKLDDKSQIGKNSASGQNNCGGTLQEPPRLPQGSTKNLHATIDENSTHGLHSKMKYASFISVLEPVSTCWL